HPLPLEEPRNKLQLNMTRNLERWRRLHNHAAVFQNEFWPDFYRPLSAGFTRRSIVKVSIIILCLALFAAPGALAAERLNLVIALDLSRSVAVKAPDQQQELDRKSVV